MSYASRSCHSAPFHRKVTEGTRGSSRDSPSATTRNQSLVVSLHRWYTACMTVPVSTPHRSARKVNRNSVSSCRERMTRATSPGAMRISVSSWRWRIGPVRWSPKRSSRRRLRWRSTASHPVRHGRADRPVRPVTAPVLDDLLELHHPVDESLWPGRTAGDVHVDGQDPVDPLDGRVAPLVAPAGTGAVAHGHAPLRLGHLLPQPDERAGHLGGTGAGHDL